MKTHLLAAACLTLAATSAPAATFSIIAEIGGTSNDANGGTYQSFGRPSVNNEGQVIGVTTVQDEGARERRVEIFDTTTGTTTAIAREGEVAPDSAGGVYETFIGVDINDSGEAVFTGQFERGGAIDRTNGRSVIAYDPVDGSRKVV